MDTFVSFVFLGGFLALAIANVWLRSADAPGFGAGLSRPPWLGREHYRGFGFPLQLAGWFLWLTAALVSIVKLIR